MRALDILKMRWISLVQRRRLETELDDELRFHLDEAVARYTSQGMSAAEARRRVRLKYGGPDQIKEECRRARGVTLIEELAADVRYALRGFRRSPGFALTAVATIAIGMGMNTALFTLIYAAVFRPLPVEDPSSVRNVYVRRSGDSPRSSYGHQYAVSFADFNYLRAHARTIELAAVADNHLSWRGHSEPLRAQLVSDNLLRLIGARPVLGRFFNAAEAQHPGGSAVVVLSHHAWQRWFGGALEVVGRPMVLNRTVFTIIGVADEKATGPLALRPDVWIPMTMQALTRPGEPLISDAAAGWLTVIGRKRPESTEDATRAELTVVAQQAVAVHSSKMRTAVTLAPGAFFNYPFLFEQGAPIAAILFLAVTLVLLVACANVANMLLARGLARRRELAIRLSMGAGRWRLVRQLLTESVLLAVAAGAPGVALAVFAGRLVFSAMPADELAGHQFDLSPDGTILLYTMSVSLLTGILFGFLPALNALRVDLTPALKAMGLEGASRRRPAWLQDTLLASQAAAGMVLLVCAGLLLRGFERGMSFDTGMDLRNVLIASFDLRQQQYTAEQSERFMTGLRDGIAGAPGVVAASLTSFSPLVSGSRNAAVVLGPDGKPGRSFLFQSDEIGHDYFATYGIPLLRGRIFTPAELRGSQRLVIVDERLVRQHFGSAEPIGRQLRLGGETGEAWEIVGVAGATQPLEPGRDTLPGAYLPMRGLRFLEAKLIVRYSGPAADAMKAIERAARDLDPTVTARLVRIEDNVAEALMPVRLAAGVASALGAVALALACTGVYAVVAFAVSRRRREVGVRMALGADRIAVLRLIVWQGLRPVLAGTALGIGLAAAAGHLVRAMLYGVSALDPMAFAGTGAVLAGAAVLAALVPARAALRVDPAVTLRYE